MAHRGGKLLLQFEYLAGWSQFDNLTLAAATALNLQLVPRIGRAIHDARPPGPDRPLAARHLDHMMVLEAGKALRHDRIGAARPAHHRREIVVHARPSPGFGVTKAIHAGRIS